MRRIVIDLAYRWPASVQDPRLRYLGVGATLFIIDLTVFLVLKDIGVSTVLAQVFSRTAGSVIGFFGHKLVSFSNPNYGVVLVVWQGLTYSMVTVINICISPLLVSSLESLLPERWVLVKVLAEFVLVIETYIILHWIFRRQAVEQCKRR